MHDAYNSPKFYSLKGLPKKFFNDFKNILLIHSESSSKNGSLNRIFDKLDNKKNIDVINTSLFESNSEIINNYHDLYKKKYDLVITVGGGTQVDIAKIAYVKCMFKNWEEKISSKDNIPINTNIKFVSMVTLPGSGAESSKASIINSNFSKKIFSSHLFIPDYVFYDTQSILALKKEDLIVRSIDAIMHSIESKNSILYNQFSEIYADYVFDKGLNFLNQYTKTFKADLSVNNIKTLCILSFYGGLAQSESGSGLCHAMAHTLEQEFRISHAESILLCSFVSLDYKRKNSEKTLELNIKKLFLNLYSLIFSEAEIRKHKNILNKIDPEEFVKRAKVDPCWKLEKERLDETLVVKLLNLKIKNKKWNI
tara:strand:- start:2979 stop:4079 length:1101 start_codon:yes stop_codon:yes gene_type:complete